MTERLIVDDDEAYVLARDLAERRGVSIAEAVVSSLRASLETEKPVVSQPASMRIPALEVLTPEQRARYHAMGALARNLAPYVKPGATSDHRDMYDEHGLPK